MPFIPRRLSSAASTLLIFALMLFPLVPFVQASAAPLAPDTENENHTSELLQFTSQGHVLGFREDGIIIAQARHMLNIDFLNSKGAIPQTDGAVSTDTDEAPALDRVTYQNIWDGVTAVYEASGSSVVKSTYYLDDGAYTNRIRLGYNRPVQLDKQGNLIITYEHGTLTESAPVAWQEIGGEKKPVEVSFVLHGEQQVGFTLGVYVPGIPVVIDPEIVWNTFLGGSGADLALDIMIDATGNVYVVGQSDATWGSPVRAYTSGLDKFAAKINSDGTLAWHTFLGGTGHDLGRNVAVDSAGNVYVIGYSSATWGSPVRAFSAGNDAAVAKLDNNGVLIWNTFLGGSGTDLGQVLDVDDAGNIYAGGYSNATWGTPVLAYTLDNDAAVAKLDNNGVLIWNTFLGGSGSDVAQGIASDGSGNVYITGQGNATWGTPIRSYTLGNDGLVAKINSDGTLAWNTFLGGIGSDILSGIDLDSEGNIYVVGRGDADWGSPIRPYSTGVDGIVARLDADGTLAWNTFLGGSGADPLFDVRVSAGDVYVAGRSTVGWGDPVLPYVAASDAYAAKLSSDGALTWHAFVGGSGDDLAWGIAPGTGGAIYIAGQSTATWGSPLRAYTLGLDAFVAKLLIDEAAPAPAPSPGRTYIPNIAVTKDATPPALPNGPGEVTYNYVVKNWGQITLTDITLKDDQCADVIFIEGDQNGNGWLETNEEWKYVCTTTLTETTVNFATARGLGGGLATVDTAITEVFVGLATTAPSIHVVKTAEPDALPAGGGEVLYTYQVRNTGEPALSNITITDDQCAPVQFISGDENANQLLDQSETWTYTCRQTIEESTQNTVIVTGDGNGRTAIDTATRIVVVADDIPPVIHLIKKPRPLILPNEGGWVTYTYEVQNPGNVSLSNVKVTDDDCTEIVHISGETNDNGMLDPDETWIFTCRKFINQTTRNTATAEGSHENHTVSNIAVANVTVGNGALTHSLIKLRCEGFPGINDPCHAVYYVGSDGFRHVFPNENTFYTWYSDFDNVIIIDEALMSSIALGANITYKPGVSMVKFTTDPKVYAVARNGVLRWIRSEDLASQLYGTDWNTKIDDISSAFFSDYTIGNDINSPDDYDPAAEEAAVMTPSESL